MKKIIHLTILLILLLNIAACSGYKPIFSSSNLQFKISDYLIKPNKKIGNQIFSKLYNLSENNKNNLEAKNIDLTIEVSKTKDATIKNNAGKVLEYRINLNTSIIVRDFLTNEEILNQNFTYTSSYRVQDQHSDTVKLENKTIENLTNKTFEDLLIKMSDSFQ